MLNFKTWLESVDTIKPSLEDAIQSFFVPEDDTIYITAASIIDGELTDRHFPFIYLESEDKIFVGEKNQYHPEIIDEVPDENIRLKLNSVYNMQPSPSGAVGRIGFQLKFPKLTRRLPERNLKKLYYGDKEVPEVEFHLKLFMSPPPHELVEIFSEIDIVAVYKTPNCKMPMVGTCLKKLKEDGMIRDESKTIVIYGDKAYKFDEALAQAQSEIKPVAASAPESGTKKKVPFYYPDYKPSDWQSAFKASGIWNPQIGDNTQHQGNTVLG